MSKDKTTTNLEEYKLSPGRVPSSTRSRSGWLCDVTLRKQNGHCLLNVYNINTCSYPRSSMSGHFLKWLIAFIKLLKSVVDYPLF